MATRAFISGKVQGVWFRESTKQEAERLGVHGWVRNLDDGRVEAVLAGPDDAVAKLLEWCHHGPDAARVDQVTAAPTDEPDPTLGFQVLR